MLALFLAEAISSQLASNSNDYARFRRYKAAPLCLYYYWFFANRFKDWVAEPELM